MGGYGFFYPQGPQFENYMSVGPHAGLRARFLLSRRHSASAGYEIGQRRFPQWINEDRNDLSQQGGVGYHYRGPVLLSADNALNHNRSNVTGGGYLGHRVTGRGAFALPADVTLAAQLAIQFFDFRSGIPDSRLGGDSIGYREDLQNHAELKLSRPLAESIPNWELSIRASYFYSDLPSDPSRSVDPLQFNRGVFVAAISWRSDAE